jgi:hypothetical protein
MATLFVALPAAYGETSYADSGHNVSNQKVMDLTPATDNRLEIRAPAVPGRGFWAGNSDNSNRYPGFNKGGTDQSKRVLTALNNSQVNDPAFAIFLPVVIRNPLPPPGGVWDTSTWDNCSWGN